MRAGDWKLDGETHRSRAPLLRHFGAGCDLELFQGRYDFGDLKDSSLALGGIPFILDDTGSSPGEDGDSGGCEVARNAEHPLPADKGIAMNISFISRRPTDQQLAAADVTTLPTYTYEATSNAGDYCHLFQQTFANARHAIDSAEGTEFKLGLSIEGLRLIPEGLTRMVRVVCPQTEMEALLVLSVQGQGTGIVRDKSEDGYKIDRFVDSDRAIRSAMEIFRKSAELQEFERNTQETVMSWLSCVPSGRDEASGSSSTEQQDLP